MDRITIRDATFADLDRILEIYSYYIENTAITFEYSLPSHEEFRGRMTSYGSKYPYLVIEQSGHVMGYAYARPLNVRAAYDWACELSVYLDRNAQKCGLGRKLYEAMEEKLKAMGILNLYACIAYPETEDEYLTRNSPDFHAHMGYREVGHFHQCGYKFGRWYDMIWMEKIIGEHRDNQPPVLPYRP